MSLYYGYEEDSEFLGTGGTGPQGAVGAKGAKGDAGAKGSKGDAGASGVKGSKGDAGAQGASGVKGSKGDAGAAGVNGSKGSKGDDGAAGAQGASGVKGAKGAAGAKGAKGDGGSKGAKGDVGTQGAKGDGGVKGAKGSDGLPGPKGTTGLRGLRGLRGITGTTGPAGTFTQIIKRSKRGRVQYKAGVHDNSQNNSTLLTFTASESGKFLIKYWFTLQPDGVKIDQAKKIPGWWATMYDAFCVLDVNLFHGTVKYDNLKSETDGITYSENFVHNIFCEGIETIIKGDKISLKCDSPSFGDYYSFLHFNVWDVELCLMKID